MQTLSFILAVTTFLTVGVLPASSISMSGTRQEKRQGEGSESILKPRAIERQVTFYHKLERALAANKIAFINLDWRGIGKSTNKGSLVDMPLTEMPKALDDVREATSFCPPEMKSIQKVLACWAAPMAQSWL